MLGRSHLVIGTTTMAVVADAVGFSITESAIIVLASVVGSLLPDIDHSNAKIIKRFPLLKIIAWLLPHRGITHSLFIPLFAILVLWFWIEVSNGSGLIVIINLLAVGLIGGYILHLLADFVTASGISLFAPLSKKRYYFPIHIRTGSLFEHLIVLTSLAGALGYFITQNN